MVIREDIVYAAAEIFGREGYERATLEQIAQRVGIKKGSLYYHIESKQDLLLAIHTLLVEKLTALTSERLTQSADPRTRLCSIIEVAMQLIAENRQEVTVFLNERRVLEGPRWRDVVLMRDEYQRIVETVIADGIDQGVFRSTPVKVTALGILGMTNWGYQWFDPEGSLSHKEIARVFADLILNGMLADGQTGDEMLIPTGKPVSSRARSKA